MKKKGKVAVPPLVPKPSTVLRFYDPDFKELLTAPRPIYKGYRKQWTSDLKVIARVKKSDRRVLYATIGKLLFRCTRAGEVYYCCEIVP